LFVAACSAPVGLSHAATGTPAATQAASTTASVTGATPTPNESATPNPTGEAAVVTKRVVLLGDSLFYSEGLPDNQDFVAVIPTDRSDLELIDVGVPGDQTKDVLARVRNATDSHPNVVVVWIGTNDALAGVGVSTYSEQLNQLLDLLAPAHLVVITPIADQGAPEAYVPYAAAARDIAKGRGIPLVDLDGVISKGDYLEDGAHLNADAVQRVARLIERLIPAS